MDDELTLVTAGPAWGLPFQSAAPFPVKLEAWLRLAGIPYRGRIENNPGRGPKKKTPWIETREGAMGDSELIIEHLERTRGVDPDHGLSARARAEGVAWRRLFEEHYHQVWEYLQFMTPAGQESAREWFAQLPALPRPLIRVMMTRALGKQLYERGIGRHTHDEIVRMGIADVDAAANWLEDRAYWHGDLPTTTDCTAFAFLALSVWVPSISRVHERARAHASIVGYCERVGTRLFPERMSRLRGHAARPQVPSTSAV